MQIGYARVSTREQRFDLQVDALRQADCEKVLQEVVSGAKAARPVLDALLVAARGAGAELGVGAGGATWGMASARALPSTSQGWGS